MATTVQMMTCATCDLAARLRSELVSARNELRAIEAQFVTASRWDDIETLPPPRELRHTLAEHRLRVVGLEQVLTDLLCDHVAEIEDAAA